MARNLWFDETFLVSFEDKMNNPKYLNQCLLSDGQVRICERYMEEHTGRTINYNKQFVYYTYQVGCRDYFLEFRGKYAILHRSRMAYKPQGWQKIRWRRLDRNEELYGRIYS